MEKTVKYYLAKEVPLNFSRSVIGEGVVSSSTKLTEMDIQVRFVKDGSLEKELTDNLRAAFRDRELQWSVHLDIVRSKATGVKTEFCLHFFRGSGLKAVLGESAYLQVEIFDVFNASGQTLKGFSSQEMSVATALDKNRTHLEFLDYSNNPAAYQILRRGMDEQITGKMNLVVIDRCGCCHVHVGDLEKMSACKRMLQEELATDAVIVPSNGAEVKCHSAFLAAQSDVFRTMFGTDMQEAKTHRIEMPDMSEEGVRAFLAYLYHWDHSKAEENCVVALELMKAGHKYNILYLEETMRKLMLSKPETWYNVDVAVKMFAYVRNLDGEWEGLKKKAVMVTKMNSVGLTKSVAFQELFRENPEAAMDFYQCSMLLWNSSSS